MKNTKEARDKFQESTIRYENGSILLRTALVLPKRGILEKALKYGGAGVPGGVLAAAGLKLFTTVALLTPVGIGTVVTVTLATGAVGHFIEKNNYNEQVRKETAEARDFLLTHYGCPVDWSFKFAIFDSKMDAEEEIADTGSIAMVTCIAPKRPDQGAFSIKLKLQDHCDGIKFLKTRECVEEKLKLQEKFGNLDKYKQECELETKNCLKEQSEDTVTNQGRAFIVDKGMTYEMVCATGTILEHRDEL